MYKNNQTRCNSRYVVVVKHNDGNLSFLVHMIQVESKKEIREERKKQ